MDLATILNPSSSKLDHHHQQQHISKLQSPPISPKHHHHGFIPSTLIANMKPRSRFTALEDAIICQGVANGLTWGQISGQLPHRKRATCFNRYRTLQGVRKSRPPSAFSPPSLYYYHPSSPFDNHSLPHHHYPSSPLSSTNTAQWLPSPPPSASPTLMNDSSDPQPFNHSIPSLVHHSYRDTRRSSTTHRYYPY